MSGFDNLAWTYDILVKLVFGSRLTKAQNAFLHLIKPGSRLLILGGGTGAIAEAVLHQQPACTITYIDASSEMIKRARNRLKNNTHVLFIHGTQDAIPKDVLFDVVITPFFLDVFPERDLHHVVQCIGKSLRNDALWMVADFCHSQHLAHRSLLTILYLFFRVTTQIEARTLPNWSEVIAHNGWTKLDFIRMHGFLESSVFKRASGAISA